MNWSIIISVILEAVIYNPLTLIITTDTFFATVLLTRRNNNTHLAHMRTRKSFWLYGVGVIVLYHYQYFTTKEYTNN